MSSRPPSKRFARRLKVALLRSGAAGAGAPAAGALITAGYLARLGAWTRRNPAPFDADLTERAFRYGKRERLFEHVRSGELGDGPIEYLEFGVAKGASFRWWLMHSVHADSRFTGFDLFTGLPEDFGPVRAGSFDTGGRVPMIDDPRARFVAGFFQDTLGPFLGEASLDQRAAGRRLVVHLDADLYSSTLFVLTRLAPILRAGDVLLFDEFGVPMHEFKAWVEFVAAYQVRATLLGQANDWLQVAFRIDKLAC
jgi:O-methyltransferase